MDGELRFGAWLKEKRLAAGLTQRALAAKVGIGYPYVSQIEASPGYMPSEPLLEKISEALGIDPSEASFRAGRLPRRLSERILAGGLVGVKELEREYFGRGDEKSCAKGVASGEDDVLG